MNWSDLNLFRDPIHEPYIWPGGRPAALLVHGFPGTPAEMRPLARVLQPMGWTVQGLLLPGFGAQYSTLGQRRYEDWLTAIVQALAALRARHHPVLLVGYSLGAALSMCAAPMAPPDGLALLAPFTWQRPNLYRAGSTLAPLLPSMFRPFAAADFANPRVRSLAATALPGVDLDDPHVQEAVRSLVVPTALVRQVVRAAWRAYQRAPELTMPTLVIQGRRDETVLPSRTRLLVSRLPNVVRYAEVNAGHILMGEPNLAWPTVQEFFMDFAARLERGLA